MKSVTFPQANCELAKDQTECETLHTYVEMKEVPVMDGSPTDGDKKDTGETKSIPWSMTACFELSEEEIQEIIKTKRIWHTQMVFGNKFQPIRMSTKNPFE